MRPLRALRALWLGAALLLAAGCASLPPRAPRGESSAFTEIAGTDIGQAISPLLEAHPGRSGLHAMPDAYDAFAARVIMAAAAQRSIDAQYFIWHDDQVGMLLFQALWQAAERGVRVRLLLDDGGTSGIDRTLALLDAHPNIELRLYSPFAYRGSRTVGYMTDFTRLNKRMHNKSFTVDNQASVVGGRNIANEYFGAAGAIGFADLDVLAIGPVVQRVSVQFDRFWNSASAYPAAQILAPPPADAAQQLQAAIALAWADPVSEEYLNAVAESPLLADLLQRRQELDWTMARLLCDDPAKTLDRSARTDVLLFPALMEPLGKPLRSFDIISPYFVPGAEGTELLAELARSGVQVRVLTNSLASSDESVVHAG
jgi:putative cardiolipin synthase